jgi:hypothetical protein
LRYLGWKHFEWRLSTVDHRCCVSQEGDDWLHEIKFDGYRMNARLDRGTVNLLTSTGLDWTHKYPPIAAAVSELRARESAWYLAGADESRRIVGVRVCPRGRLDRSRRAGAALLPTAVHRGTDSS